MEGVRLYGILPLNGAVRTANRLRGTDAINAHTSVTPSRGGSGTLSVKPTAPARVLMMPNSFSSSPLYSR